MTTHRQPEPQPGFLAFAVRYGLRSLARNKRRTALVVSTVGLSTFVTIVGMSYASAVIRIWADGAIDYGLGHAQVHTRAYADNPDVLRREHLMRDDDPDVVRLLAEPGLAAAAKRIRFEGTISSSNRSVYFLGVAVDPPAELRVAPSIFRGSDQGRFLDADDQDGIVLGRLLAENLGLAVGDSASLMTISLGGEANASDVLVRGIIDPPLPALSKRIVYMHLGHARRALRLQDSFTELALRLEPGVALDPWAARAKAALDPGGKDLKTWYELDPLIRRAEGLGKSLIAFMCFLLFVSSGISVANIVYLLVAERAIEIGTLMALGARPRDVRRLFVLEASLIATFGGLAGAGLGLAAIVASDAVGIPFKSPFHSGLLEIHPKVEGLVTLGVAAAALVICHAAALLPSRLAARVEPVVAFRGQLT
jgi:putative ABC transport system permease protein